MTDKKDFKIFVLEDNPKRMEWFNNHLADQIRAHAKPFEDYKDVKIEIFKASTVQNAELLWNEHQPFDAYFLDHDLDGKVMVESTDPNTGYAFSMFLSDQGVNGLKEQVFIHSLNTVGAENMKGIFIKAKRVQIFNF